MIEPSLVSVVIPTTLRDELSRAIGSVLAQSITRERIQIILVVDREEEAFDVAELRRMLGLTLRDKIVATGGHRGGGFARRLGGEIADGAWIAYLDDDDEWDPDRLSVQLRFASTRPRPDDLILGCRVRLNGGERKGEIDVPAVPFAGATTVEDYLFRRRSMKVSRSTIYTSTLLASRKVAMAVPWATDLRRHQDWDWLLRASRLPGIDIYQLDEVLATIWVGSSNSISRGSDWQASLSWALGSSGDWSRHTLADFLAAQPLRYALQARSLRGVSDVAAAIVRTRTIPAASCLAIGAAGVVPRAGWEHWMARRRATPHRLGLRFLKRAAR